jgi:hypothetical protein
MTTFVKAHKRQSKARIVITGPTGSGKTYSALSVAAALGKRVAVIDTEQGSASLYSDQFDFDVLELNGDYHPQRYVEAIKAAAAAGYDVCVIDSITHEWNGKNGVLEIAGGKFTGWKDARPAHEAFVQCVVSMRTKMHIIATARSAMEYVQEVDSTGKKVVNKIGMEAKTDKDMTYEFDVQGEMDHQHNMHIGKTRCSALDQQSFYKPGKELATILLNWLEVQPYDPQPARMAIAALPDATDLDKTQAERLTERDELGALYKSIVARNKAEQTPA